jgi:hypothetical protein
MFPCCNCTELLCTLNYLGSRPSSAHGLTLHRVASYSSPPLLPLFRMNGTHSVYWWCQFMRNPVHYKGRGGSVWAGEDGWL